jgi:Uma2 family endonuclease
MSALLDAPLLTTEDLLAMPRNGSERWLIKGQLREKPMTVRNRMHSWIMANLVYFLRKWLESQLEPHGKVLCGEVGCRLSRNPDTTVGIDVAYVAANLMQSQTGETTLIEGVPTLIAEILSPSDKIEEIEEKIKVYQKAGVPLIWVVNPYDRTITIYRLGAEPELVNIRQELTGDPQLPGFRVAAAEVFA